MGKRLEDLALDPHREFRGVYKTARGRLAAFLTDLNPLFRRLLTGDQLDGFDNIDYLEFDAPRRHQFKQVERKYFRLLCRVCKEGPQQYGIVNAEFLDNTLRQAVLYEKRSGAAGAPRKAIERRRDVQVSREAERLMHHLKLGLERAVALRKHGRYGSDDSEIRKMLQSLELYSPPEIDAIVASRSVRAAAARLLTHPIYNGDRRSVETIQAAISRGMNLRRQMTARRHPKS
jgi:hypothetical protein